MNSILLHKSAFGLSSLTAITLLISSLSANAQTVEPNPNPNLVNPVTNHVPIQNKYAVSIPVPGSVDNSSMVLFSASRNNLAQSDQAPQAPQAPQTPQTPENQQTPQTPENQQTQPSKAKVGGSTRGGSSYIGIGGNVGLGGGVSSLSDGNFAVISKIGFTKNFSFRPGAILGDNTTVLLPVTLDFPLRPTGDKFIEPQGIAPYIGVGAALKVRNGSDTAVLVTGGIDVPLNQQFTANVAVNAGFFSQTDVGLILGVGYNFSGL